MTDSERSLVAWLHADRDRRVPRVATWEGEIKLPKGKGAALEVATCTDPSGRTRVARELLAEVAAATARGERFLEVRLDVDVLTVRGLDWRDDHEAAQNRWVRPLLEAAAALGGKGSVTRMWGVGVVVRDGRPSTWGGEGAVKYTAKGGALEVGESKPAAKKTEAAALALAPAFDAWLAATPEAPERRTRKDRYGYVDAQGRWALPPIYSSAGAFREGLASVVQDGERRVIDRAGRVVMSRVADAAPCVHGLFAVGVSVDRVMGETVVGRDVRWGYADTAGVMQIPPTFVEAAPFTGPLAHVKVPESAFAWYSAFVDRTGQLVGPSRFQATTGFAEDRAWCFFAETRSSICIDGRGQPAFTGDFFSAGAFSEGLSAAARTSDPSKWGYVDREGRWVIDARFDRVGAFSEGRAAVTLGDETFLIDAGGERHGETFLCAVGSLSEGLMPAARASDAPEATPMLIAPGKMVPAWVGFLDRDGRWAIEPRFPRAQSFHEGRALAAQGTAGTERWGFVDPGGSWAIAPTFFWADRFAHGVAPVRTTDLRYGLVDRDGGWVLAPEWKELEPAPRFEDGLIWVQHPDRRGALAVGTHGTERRPW